MGDNDEHDWQTVKGRQRQGKVSKQFRTDIATTKNYKKENYGNLTTYFFTDFPDNFGAKALFNTFYHYGNVMEVLIPAKRNKRGKRFDFARFVRVTNAHKFESFTLLSL
ncbi:hypothetical protein TSUD_240210 [Trifolium subterraneum]|uniref:RRM domain-containing protein n=1 Tax=Trifolium subterraneum TaxID=3900 RepID=A0A2Z6LNH5_TRISU|nr:hypothetical protein TSUD_240210 [Trifolium subterraneum]